MAEHDYQQSLRKRWKEASETELPTPWRAVAVPTLGGITAVGFDRTGGYLLCLSHSGRGVIDCSTGRVLARDYDENEAAWLNRSTLKASGIGPLASASLRVAGSYIGGGLPAQTSDRWSVHAASPDWPNTVAWAEPPGSRGFYSGGDFFKLWDWDTPFAYGFSESGTSLVIACSNDVRLWTRAH